jgi:hypothetical protein
MQARKAAWEWAEIVWVIRFSWNKYRNLAPEDRGDCSSLSTEK